jgi:hypothetical protein
MRLPQSIMRFLSVHRVDLLTLGVAITLLGTLPVSASVAAPQLTCTPTFLRFAGVVVGQTQTLLVTVTNSGETSVTLSGVAVSNSTFTPSLTTSSLSPPLILPAGQSVNLNVSFAPAATGWTGGTIVFSSDASNPSLPLLVEGAGVSSQSTTASPSRLSFSQVPTGTSSTLPVVLTNALSQKITVSTLQTMGSGFSASGPTLPMILDAGQSITVSVTFTPQAAGTNGGSLYVSGAGLIVPLTGTGTTTGTGQLTLAPAPLNFGNVPVGTTVTQPMTMSAVGATVTISSASSSSSQFVLDGASFPLTIAAGQSLSFNVAFTPANSGTVSGSLSFLSNASNPQGLESLAGTGTVTQYNVSLVWNSSSDAVGYNVYRSTAANGTYAKINSTLDSNTAYSDGTVVSGQTYYYAATSVNSSGQESSRSTPPVQATVP